MGAGIGSYTKEGREVLTLEVAKHVCLGESHVGKEKEPHPEGIVLDDDLNTGNGGGPARQAGG